MQIGKDDLLAGVPAKRLRDTLTKMDNASWSRRKLRDELRLERRETAGVLAALIADGYLERTKRPQGWFASGPAAPRLVNVRFIRRIDREKADALVASLIQRAKDINADKRFVLCVTELQAFGSYTYRSKEDLGDVDIAFSLEVKPAYAKLDVTEQSKLTHRRLGLTPRNFLDFLFLPKKAVLRTLKNRSPYISLHPIEDLAKIGAIGEIIFSAPVGL
jgi:hypothetical protein